MRIHFEKDEFPTDLVDEYLDKWPSTEIDLTDFEIPEEPITAEPAADGEAPPPAGCGDGKVRGEERCDPAGTECIIEDNPIFEIDEGAFSYAGEDIIAVPEIIIPDNIPAFAYVTVNRRTQIMQENQIKKFGEFGYVHMFSILPDRVKLAYGYHLGDCSAACRCALPEEEEGVVGECGDGIKEGAEECEKPGDECDAKSGLKSICSNTCKCPEPLIGLTFCGDGPPPQRPNSFGVMEMCDPPSFIAGSCTLPGGGAGWCTLNCQCLGTIAGNFCGDNILNPNPPASEECDPPGVGCIKNGKVGTCNKDCGCNVIVPEPQDLIALKNVICGGVEECFGINKTCTKGGLQGLCNASCKCVIKGDGLPVGPSCRNSIVEPGEACDPPGPCFYKITGFITPLPGTCREDCTACDPDYIFDCTTAIPYNEREEVKNIYNTCSGVCTGTFLGGLYTAELKTIEDVKVLIVDMVDEPIHYRYAFINNEPAEKCTSPEGAIITTIDFDSEEALAEAEAAYNACLAGNCPSTFLGQSCTMTADAANGILTIVTVDGVTYTYTFDVGGQTTALTVTTPAADISLAELTEAATAYNACLDGACPDTFLGQSSVVIVDTVNNELNVLMADDTQYVYRFDANMQALELSVTTSADVLTGSFIINTDILGGNKQIIISIIAIIMIAGIVIFNFVKKD